MRYLDNNDISHSLSSFWVGRKACKQRLLCAVLPALLGVAAPVCSDVDEARLEQVITTATRIETSALQYIGSVSAIDEQALALTGATHIQESLLRVPGVNLQRGNGQEYLPAIRSPVLSGAGACGGFLMAQDGIPLRAAGFCNINELFEAHSEVAQRMEVIRGPGSVLYGSNALHGVVNVISNDPRRDYGFSAVEVGPDDYARLKFGASGGDEQARLGVNISLTHDGAYRDDSGLEQQKITLRHHTQYSEWSVDSGLTLTNLEQETAGYINGKDSYKNAPLARQNFDPEAYRDVRSARLWSKWSLEASELERWVITPYVRYTEMAFLQHFLPGDPLEENGQRGAGVLLSYYRTLTPEWQLIAGVDAEYTRSYLRETQAEPTQGSAFLQATVPAGKHYDYDVNAVMLAPYAELSWDFAARWQLTVGARYEWMQYDYDNQMLTGRTRDDGSACGFGGCRYARPPSSTDSFRNWSPKLGVSYQVADQQLLYASLARGFRAPQATELYRLQNQQVVADLDSEQLDSLEIGWKGRAAALDFALAAYVMRKDNFIFRDSESFNRSNGETEHQGVELNLLYRLSDSWDLGVSGSVAKHRYAYSDVLGAVNIDGNEVDSAPQVFGSARLGWNFASGSRAELEWQHMGDYFLDPENLHDYGGHNLLNLRVGWQLSPQWRAQARLINLADRDYAERADYTTFTEERYFPGAPRSVFVGVEWSWR